MAKNPFDYNLDNLYGTPKHKRQPVSSSQKKAILIKQKGRCAVCKRILTGSIQYDHIKEVHKGGKSTTDNLRALCGSCHDERHILDKAKQMDKKRLKKTKSNQSIYGDFKMPSYKDLGFK